MENCIFGIGRNGTLCVSKIIRLMAIVLFRYKKHDGQYEVPLIQYEKASIFDSQFTMCISKLSTQVLLAQEHCP